MKKTVPYEGLLQEHLADKSYAVEYLNECTADNDPTVAYIALCDVLKAHPQMAQFFISAYARYLRATDLDKLQHSQFELHDYFESHREVLRALSLP